MQAYYEAPATAAYAKINILESGTPASSNLVYLSNVTLPPSPECVGAITSAATVDYAAGPWPPSSITQLI
ncbi:hypothetical protein [Streptacidiphilus cavernicola]|uniref:Uncharacterized protein n=1 Tax=Streptacidiphilus cavernicola TaxID=3342716 RepID=A0ABV6VYM3_9ACTN